jgi:hypothetical protein
MRGAWRLGFAVLYAAAAGINHGNGNEIGAAFWLAGAVLWVLAYYQYGRKGSMMVKRYHSVNPAELPTVEFELAVWRDGLEEIHHFTARPQTDAGAMIEFSRSSNDGERQARAVFRMMSKMLINTDGVPSQWVPTIVDKPKNAGADYQPKFRAPGAPAGDGKLHPMSEAGKWTDPAKGSSRRRWDNLMFEDQDITVDIGVVSEILTDLAGDAAGLPTNG